jgi:hypothetical protein
MAEAKLLLRDVQTALRDVDEQMRSHPYPALVSAKRPSIESLQSFPGHQYHILCSDIRSFSTLVSRFGNSVSRDFFIELLECERDNLDRLVVMGSRFDMSEDDLSNYEVTPKGFACATFLAHEALYAPAAEIALGFLVNVAAWGHNCARTSAALRDGYGFDADDTEFLDTCADMPFFEIPALRIIQEGLDSGDSPKLMRRGARLFQAYAKMFWDAMADAIAAEPAQQ